MMRLSAIVLAHRALKTATPVQDSQMQAAAIEDATLEQVSLPILVGNQLLKSRCCLLMTFKALPGSG